MDFLKTGFDLTSIHDSSLGDDSVKMLTALMTLFVEDAMKTAIIYTNTRSRKEITAYDMRKSLMYQAQTFFSQDESLEQRYIRMIETMNEEDEEDSDEEDSGEEDSGEEDSGEEDSGEEGPGEKGPGEKVPGEKVPGEKGPGEEVPGEKGPGEKGPGEHETCEHEEGSAREYVNDDDEMCTCDETIIDMDLANRMDELESAWDTWNPIDPVLCLLKRSIDKINPDALAEC